MVSQSDGASESQSESQLESQFESAAEWVRTEGLSAVAALSNEGKLALYGLYKRAAVGEASSRAVDSMGGSGGGGLLEKGKRRAKLNAWKKVSLKKKLKVDTFLKKNGPRHGRHETRDTIIPYL